MATQYIVDPQTGKEIPFEWNGKEPPSQGMMTSLLVAARGSNTSEYRGDTSGRSVKDLQREWIQREQKVVPQQDAIDSLSKPEKLMVGIGAGMYDAYKGIQQVGATLGNKLGVVSPETVSRITQEGMDARADFAPLRDQSTLATIGEFTGKAAPYIAVPGGVAGGAATRALTSSLAGGLMGATEFVPEGGSRGTNAAIGAVGGGAMSGVLSAGSKLISPFISDATKALPNQVLADKFNIPLTLSEATGKVTKTDSMMERLPSILGIGKFREKQQDAVKQAAQSQFAKYVVDPSLATTSEMKIANDAHLNTLYENVARTGKQAIDAPAPETLSATQTLLNDYPDVFASIQDARVKGILKNVAGDTKDYTVNTGVLNQNGSPIFKNVTPALSFDDMWRLRKGIGQAMSDAERAGNGTAKGQYSAIYSAVSNDLDNMLSSVSGGAVNEFKAANDAFKQYSVKFDVLRQAYDKAIGTTGSQQAGFFSPQKYGTELKNLANNTDYKKNVKWSDSEIKEMTGLANILQVAKRAGQYTENPPTGNRWGALQALTGGVGGIGIGAAFGLQGAAAAGAAAGTGATIAGITKFLTTTEAGKRLALGASKIEPTDKNMKVIMQMVYNQVPKMAADSAIEYNQ